MTFLVTRVFAPDPTALFLAPAGNGFVNSAAAAAESAKVRASLGLGQPLVVQYYRFIDQLLHGNLGRSFQTGRPVTTDLLDRLPATAELAVYALVFGVSLGVVVGVVCAIRRDGMFDHVARFFTVGALSLPQFWIGLVLLWLFYHQAELGARAGWTAPARRCPAPYNYRFLHCRWPATRRLVDHLGRRPPTAATGPDTGPRAGRSHLQDRPHVDGGSTHI